MAKSRKSVSKPKPDSDAAEIVSEAASDARATEVSETTPDAQIAEPDKKEDAESLTGSAAEVSDETGDRTEIAPADEMQGEVEVSQETKENEGEATRGDTPTADEKTPEDVAEHREGQEPEPEKPGVEPAPTQMVPVPAARPEPARSVFWPMVFGGMVAAALGFIVGRGDALDAYLPASMQRSQIDMAAIEGMLAEQAASLTAEVEAQATRIAALEARPEAADAPNTSSTLSALSETLAALEARTDDLEARPLPTETPREDGSAAEIEALRQSLAAQEASIAQQQAKLDAQAEEIAILSAKADAAADAARNEAASILARAALTRVVTAVETGDTFTPALGDLEETVAIEIPEALRQAAEDGVPTLAALQSDFPDAARAGLAAARSEVPESEVEGFGDFLRRQLGARSLTPREGDDPDAILSRAEAALRGGDLGLALSEMDALPDAAKSAMQAWLDAATARQAAEDAAKALADSLQSN